MSVKLERLIVSNFCSIGSEPVNIDLDDIVILVGGNNAGKSTILKAYEAAVNSQQIPKSEFHNCEIDPENLPTVEIHTIVSGTDTPSINHWCKDVTAEDTAEATAEDTAEATAEDTAEATAEDTAEATAEDTAEATAEDTAEATAEATAEDTAEATAEAEILYRVKERWIWSNDKDKPLRIGYRIDMGANGQWATSDETPMRPWANDNVARSKRPKAHRVGTFDNPQDQSDAIKAIIVDVLLEDKIREFTPAQTGTSYSSLLEQFNELKDNFVEASEDELDRISDDISSYVSKIIPEHSLKLGLNKEELKTSSFKLFDKKEVELSFGKEGSRLPIENHGSGARRTLLWAVLKKIAELGYESKKGKAGYSKLANYKSHLLLLDEPELSLHPQAAREARDMLYTLAGSDNNWQVMITTHSPSFIDLTRDHTKIVRVENKSDVISATTVYKPELVSFDEDEKECIKLLNLMSPEVMEFFFGGKVLLVEGDTEFTAFGKIISDAKDAGETLFNDVLIIRCGGKVQVSLLMRILNHFMKKYFVLHDIDTKKILKHVVRNNPDTTIGGKVRSLEIVTNGAWTNNHKFKANMSDFSVVYGSVIDFETAYFDEAVTSGKPLNALTQMKKTENYQTVKDLLTSIITGNDALLPSGAVKWTELSELDDKFETYKATHPEVEPQLPE